MKNRRLKADLLILILLIMLLPIKASAFSYSDFIRIKITQGTSIGFKSSGSYDIYVNSTVSSYIIGTDEEFVVRQSSGELELYSVTKSVSVAKGATIEIKQKNMDSVQINYMKGLDGLDYSKYPENLLFKNSTDNTKILCINNVRMESYLKGVLPYEIGAGSPIEALKAQAVAARTYAVANLGRFGSEGFDLTNDTLSQVYQGYTASYFSPINNVCKAVDNTSGQVLTYGGKLISALYSSNNGGYTADPANVWGGTYAYLKSKADTYNSSPNNYPWAYTYSADDLTAKLSSRGVGQVKDIDIVERAAGGYVTKINVTNENNNVYSIVKDATRTSLGLKSMVYNIIKNRNVTMIGSSLKTVSSSTVSVKSASGTTTKNVNDIFAKSSSSVMQPKITNFTFSGSGYGHGVGMSQDGAILRAKAGQTYDSILKFYYDGIEIKSNYNSL